MSEETGHTMSMGIRVSIQLYTQSIIFDQAKKKTLEQINLHDRPPQTVIPGIFENGSKEKEYVLQKLKCV